MGAVSRAYNIALPGASGGWNLSLTGKHAEKIADLLHRKIAAAFEQISEQDIQDPAVEAKEEKK